jgi:hypothetical protein
MLPRSPWAKAAKVKKNKLPATIRKRMESPCIGCRSEEPTLVKGLYINQKTESSIETVLEEMRGNNFGLA